MRSPPVLYLGVHSSLGEKAAGESLSGVTRITLYAPYWLNNRTGGWRMGGGRDGGREPPFASAYFASSCYG